MSAAEFKAWLEGFLEGRTTFTAADAERIRQKASDLANPLAGFMPKPSPPVTVGPRNDRTVAV